MHNDTPCWFRFKFLSCVLFRFSIYVCIFSASLYERSAYVTGVARLAWTICLSPHVSSRVIPQCIRTPCGVVSGFGLGSGVPDFGGDRRRGRGSLGVNKMQKWPKMAY